MKKRILLVEDDPFHAQVVCAALKSKIGCGVHVVASEKDFRNEYEELWYAAILDQMMPWTTEDDRDPFSGAPAEGPMRAGSRCYQMLKDKSLTKEVPVVFFTNLEQKTIPAGAHYVRKVTDPDLKKLIATIRQVIKP